MVSAIPLIKARVASLATLQTIPSTRLGVTFGGFTHDPADGTAWYIKHHDNPDHAWSEHLSNQLYRHILGTHAAPHSVVLHDPIENKPVYLSKKIPGFTTMYEYHNAHPESATERYGEREHAAEFLKGAAADLLVGNTDLHDKNIGIVGGHKVVRIDNGANFLHSAIGMSRGKSGEHIDLGILTNHAHALKHLGIGQTFGDRFAILTHPSILRPQVKHILRAQDEGGGWRKFVEQHIGAAPEALKDKAVQRLNSRTTELQDHVSERSSRANLGKHYFDLLKRSPSPSSGFESWSRRVRSGATVIPMPAPDTAPAPQKPMGKIVIKPSVRHV